MKRRRLFTLFALGLLVPTLVIPILDWHHHAKSEPGGHDNSCAICATAVGMVAADLPAPVVLQSFETICIRPAEQARDVQGWTPSAGAPRGPPACISVA